MEKTGFERMGGTYHREGDYLLPDLQAPEAPRIGKYGLLRHQYLRTNKRAIFAGLQMSGKLNAHLEQIDREATETGQRLTAQIAASEGVTESLKRRDQMAWVGAMNNIRNRAEETVLNDLIYA
ncbi:MAG: TnpV protein [Lachnospiraceae bacterium]